jgi:syntaxin 5
MVAEQRETVQRIDSDTHDIMDNVTGAQRELLIFYNNVSSNRWLILKIFGVLIVFVRFYLLLTVASTLIGFLIVPYLYSCFMI